MKMIDESKQKLLQRKYSDKVYKSYYKKGWKKLYPESLIGNFVNYYPLKKAISLLPFDLVDKSVLSICCGDGFEAEYVYKLGAKVTVSDISDQAVKAAKRRCPFLNGVVADAESLPFKNESFDLVLVRDGLHHLPNPYKGFREMNRVSKIGFIIIEAQRNFITEILIMFKLAEEYEISGNYVYRFTRQEVHELMQELNVKNYIIKTFWCRYSDFLSKRIYPFFNNNIWLSIFKFSFSILNILLGYFGNSLVVVGIKY